MATSVWQRQVGDLLVESYVQLADELCHMRSSGGRHYTRELVSTERLFVFAQSTFKTFDNKLYRWTADYAMPGGLLLTKIGKLECCQLTAGLAELGQIKNPQMPLELYANKSVLSFLNDYFCKKAPKRPKIVW
jgi:hypothetical protein